MGFYVGAGMEYNAAELAGPSGDLRHALLYEYKFWHLFLCRCARDHQGRPARKVGLTAPPRDLTINQMRKKLERNHLLSLIGDCFYQTAGCGLILSSVCLLVACVSVRVESLTHETYPPQTSHEPVQWLETEPGTPYVELARIIAMSQSVDEDGLRDKILTRAATLGADAVVLGKSDVLESMGAETPYQSTMGPAASDGGWPFYYDRWSFLQGSTDPIRRTEYLSGTAIRYVRQKGSEHGY